ncbi:MAG: hypothetical protein RAO75_03065 [Candidatus Chlorobium antarcticum]|nr:hypothetical protein [Candidatus Chlorobium antarcticum]
MKGISLGVRCCDLIVVWPLVGIVQSIGGNNSKKSVSALFRETAVPEVSKKFGAQHLRQE